MHHMEYPTCCVLGMLDINRVSQVWSIDISYIRMKQGFMYLSAIIDIRNRFIVGWNLSNTLE